MGRSRRDIGGYRGRRTFADVLRGVALTLGTLVVLLVAVLFYGQRYLLYTDDGLKLNLPFFQRQEPAPPPADLGNVSIKVEDPVDSSQQAEPDPEPENPSMAALQLPLSAILDGTAVQKLEQAGANALIVEMKGPSGQLGWASEESMAALARVNSKQEGINDLLRQWNQGEVYTIARVCCFRDDSVPYYRNPVAIRSPNGNWRDELVLRWMNPTHPDTRSYLAGLCRELAGLGFDEILLDCYTFPLQGKQENIVKGENYNAETFPQLIDDFLGQAAQAVEPYGTRLSVQARRETFTGEERAGGLTNQMLESYIDRFWVAEDDLIPTVAQLIESAGITNGAERLVTVTEQLREDLRTDQAVLGS